MRVTARLFCAAALFAASRLSAAGRLAPQTDLPATPTPPAATPTPAVVPVTPPAAPAPASPSAPPAAAAPTPSTALRIVDPPVVSIARLPPENPFGSTAQTPAVLPAKIPVADSTFTAGMFVSVHVDQTGKSLAVRRDRDPIPSLAAETLKSVSRWTFSPARRGGQPVDTWGAFRFDLSVEVRAPKILQMAFTPVTPTTPIPTPFEWFPEAEWLESRHPAAPSDGTVPIDSVDTAPVPQRTPWSADSYKGPFTVKFWVKVDKTGRIERAIPLEVSDPILLVYFRKAMTTWTIRPAQSAGAAVESWNELTLGGQVSYSDEIKQIIALRKAIGP